MTKKQEDTKPTKKVFAFMPSLDVPVSAQADTSEDAVKQVQAKFQKSQEPETKAEPKTEDTKPKENTK